MKRAVGMASLVGACLVSAAAFAGPTYINIANGGQGTFYVSAPYTACQPYTTTTMTPGKRLEIKCNGSYSVPSAIVYVYASSINVLCEVEHWQTTSGVFSQNVHHNVMMLPFPSSGACKMVQNGNNTFTITVSTGPASRSAPVANAAGPASRGLGAPPAMPKMTTLKSEEPPPPPKK